MLNVTFDKELNISMCVVDDYLMLSNETSKEDLLKLAY